MNRICVYCGNRLGEKSKFCMCCGKAAAAVQSERERLLQVIEELMEPMEHLFAIYLDMDGANQRLQSEEKRIRNLKSHIQIVPWVVGIFAAYISLNAVGNILAGLGLGILNLFVCPLVAVGSFFLATKIARKPYEGSLESAGRNREKLLEEYKAKNQVHLEAMDAVDREALEVIPPDYRSVGALRFFYTALLNQRAQTMQQAVNLYEMENHQARMEQGQAIQTQYMRSIQQSSERTAVAAEFLVLDRIEHYMMRRH